MVIVIIMSIIILNAFYINYQWPHIVANFCNDIAQQVALANPKTPKPRRLKGGMVF